MRVRSSKNKHKHKKQWRKSSEFSRLRARQRGSEERWGEARRAAEKRHEEESGRRPAGSSVDRVPSPWPGMQPVILPPGGTCGDGHPLPCTSACSVDRVSGCPFVLGSWTPRHRGRTVTCASNCALDRVSEWPLAAVRLGSPLPGTVPFLQWTVSMSAVTSWLAREIGHKAFSNFS